MQAPGQACTRPKPTPWMKKMGALSLAPRPGRGVIFRRLDTESHTCNTDTCTTFKDPIREIGPTTAEDKSTICKLAMHRQLSQPDSEVPHRSCSFSTNACSKQTPPTAGGRAHVDPAPPDEAPQRLRSQRHGRREHRGHLSAAVHRQRQLLPQRGRIGPPHRHPPALLYLSPRRRSPRGAGAARKGRRH